MPSLPFGIRARTVQGDRQKEPPGLEPSVVTSSPASNRGQEDQPAKPSGELTQLLIAWTGGSAEAREELVRRVYPELRRLAAARLRAERRNITLQPTELVSELVLRLVGESMPLWESRAHFFAIAARLLRQILVDHARHRNRHKRGSGEPPLSLSHVDVIAQPPGADGIDLLDLEQALERLRRADPMAEELIALRFYGGMPIEDAALVLGIGRSTAVRKFRAARAYMRQQMLVES
ncbi:MAG: ECF-type sigma factor [Thermoanaerobaculia bacterium]